MEEEIKRSKKNENIMVILLIFLLLIFTFIVVLVIVNKDRTVVVEEPPVIDENTYIKLENVDTTDFLTIYKNADLKKVTFINIPDVLVSTFYAKQDNFINTLNDNLINNKSFIDKYNIDNNVNDYTVNSELDSIVLYDLKDNILSLLYLIEDNVDYIGLNNHITNIFIDVSNNSLITTDSLLEKYNLTKNIICLEVFDNIVNYHDDKFVNSDTKVELTREEILTKKDDYVNLLIDNFESYIYLYFNQDNLYLKYNRNDISNLLFNENLEKVKYSTLKLENK